MMNQNGKPLSKLQGFGGSMRYSLPNGETVRIRTCNDHLLIVDADRTAEGAKLGIEGTDWLLIIMPEIKRTPGKVIAYLVPTKVAVSAIWETHKAWLATNPKTKGDNTNWTLLFPKKNNSPISDFATRWNSYRLKNDAS